MILKSAGERDLGEICAVDVVLRELYVVRGIKVGVLGFLACVCDGMILVCVLIPQKCSRRMIRKRLSNVTTESKYGFGEP